MEAIGYAYTWSPAPRNGNSVGSPSNLKDGARRPNFICRVDREEEEGRGREREWEVSLAAIEGQTDGRVLMRGNIATCVASPAGRPADRKDRRGWVGSRRQSIAGGKDKSQLLASTRVSR